MQQQFDTKENKGLIWNLMNESGVFNGIQNEFLDNVKRDFENKIAVIKMTIQPKDTLTLLNKRVLSEMMVDMGKYKNVSYVAYGNANANANSTALYTAKDVSSQRQKLLSDSFDKKKDEFTSLIGNKPPAAIDFSDKLDKPIGSEIENMLAATIARRENELNIVLEKNDMNTSPAVAAKWLNTDNISNVGAERHIKIGQNTTLDDKSIIDIKTPKTSTASAATQKQVRFTESQIIPDKPFDDEIDNNPDLHRFLSIVNDNNDNNDNHKNKDTTILELLFQKISAIEEQQREIIALLSKNKKD